jgi:hypothetical protein
MSKPTVSRGPAGDNGRPVGDAYEPADGRPGNFDLADLETGASAVREAAPDPFDPAALRLSGDQAAGLGVKRALLTVPTRKPGRDEFVRVHPSDDYALPTTVIELKAEREVYLIAPGLREALATESTLSARMLFTAISRQGVVFLWPVRLPGSDGRVDEWSRSALEAAGMARTHWIRVQANMHLGAYEVFQATGDLPEPEWPELSFAELLRIAFRDRYIAAPDHPVLRKLRGEV